MVAQAQELIRNASSLVGDGDDLPGLQMCSPQEPSTRGARITPGSGLGASGGEGRGASQVQFDREGRLIATPPGSEGRLAPHPGERRAYRRQDTSPPRQALEFLDPMMNALEQQRQAAQQEQDSFGWERDLPAFGATFAQQRLSQAEQHLRQAGPMLEEERGPPSPPRPPQLYIPESDASESWPPSRIDSAVGSVRRTSSLPQSASTSNFYC